MTVGIVGLGLIGGSLAKAYSREENWSVLACDTDLTVQGYALLSGMAEDALTEESAKSCDLILIATYPAGGIAWLENMAPHLGENTLVIDCIGVKEEICAKGFALAEEYGFTFVGGHPMAGSQRSGIKYSSAELFAGSSMVIVPPRLDDMALLQRIKNVLAPVKFGSISISSAEHHDAVIAFTSHLTHIVANALVKSPTAVLHQGYSAGSYRDLTRVAELKPSMWSELFMANKENLVREIDFLTNSLDKYRQAILNNDLPELERLLEEGSSRKKEIDAI